MPSGCKITSAQKLLILSVYLSIVHAAKSSLFPDKALRSAVKKTAEQVGLNYQTVRTIISENERNDEFVESRKSVKRRCKKLVKAALAAYIRNTVHDIFATNEQPTVDMIHRKLCEGAHFKFSRAATFRLLRKIGFVYDYRNTKFYIMERADIALKRRIYLDSIKHYRNLDYTNPIELIWSNIKRRVKLRNNTFKLKDVEVLVHTAIAEINHQMWKNNIRHVIKIEADYRVRYCHDRFHLRDHDYCGAAVSAAVHAGEADVPSASSRTAFLPNFHFCVSTDTDPTT